MEIYPNAAALRNDSIDPARLRAICKDVEGIFMSTLLKEGIKLESEESEEGANNAPLFETALESMAQSMAENGGFGVADILYAQLSGDSGPQSGAAPAQPKQETAK